MILEMGTSGTQWGRQWGRTKSLPAKQLARMSPLSPVDLVFHRNRDLTRARACDRARSGGGSPLLGTGDIRRKSLSHHAQTRPHLRPRTGDARRPDRPGGAS